MTAALQEARAALLEAFPGSFINERDEFIAHPRTNQYIILKDCKTPAWRNRKFQAFMREGVNKFLDTSFSMDDMAVIYDRLGNRIHHDLTMEFITHDMDIGWLKEAGQ